MKEIYIVSYFYAPANMMAAIRMSKLSKYFNEFGYKVNVITSVNNSLLFLKEQENSDPILENDINSTNINVIKVSHSKLYINFAKLLRKPQSSSYKKSNTVKQNKNNEISYKIKKKVLHYLLFFTSLIQDFDFYIRAIKVMKKKKIGDNSVIISSYGPLASHLVAYFLSRKNSINWIADFRDPIAQPENYKIEFLINKWFEKKICGKAKKVVAVSEGYLTSLGMNNDSKGKVITNGYDSKDLNYISEKYRSNKFTLVYTGTLYSGKRDLSPLFKAMRELIEENKIDVKKIQLSYAGVQEEYYKYEAKRYGLENQVFSLGSVSRLEALNLQNSADILIVATWNNFENSGILPGKFLEYLMLGKNILALVSGNKLNSEIRTMIKKTNTGFCYEDGNKEIEFKNLKLYIENKYEEFINEASLKFVPNDIEVKKYTYESIAKSYLKLMNDL